MEPVTVRLAASKADGYLTLVVENDYDPALSKPKRGAGVGLTNIRRRLQLIYGADASCETNGENGVYRATLRMPVVIPEYK
jgi:sensor histidine kinase YesM